MSEHHHTSIKGYIGVFLALMCLTVLTVVASKVHMPGYLHIFVALVIAFLKALLVLTFFMHLRDNPKVISAIAATGFIFLFVMLAFMLSDLKSRGMVPNPQPWLGEPATEASASVH